MCITAHLQIIPKLTNGSLFVTQCNICIHTPAEENNIFFLLEKYIDQKTISWQTKQKAEHVWMENMDVLILIISEAELNALMMDKHGQE